MYVLYDEEDDVFGRLLMFVQVLSSITSPLINVTNVDFRCFVVVVVVSQSTTNTTNKLIFNVTFFFSYKIFVYLVAGRMIYEREKLKDPTNKKYYFPPPPLCLLLY